MKFDKFENSTFYWWVYYKKTTKVKTFSIEQNDIKYHFDPSFPNRYTILNFYQNWMQMKFQNETFFAKFTIINHSLYN